MARTDSDNQNEALLEAAWSALEALAEWTDLAIEDALIVLIDEMGVPRRDGIGAVRVAVTGSPVSPPLFEVMASLGRERALARIRNAQQR